MNSLKQPSVITFALLFLTAIPQASIAETVPVPVDRPTPGVIVDKTNEPNSSVETNLTNNKLEPYVTNSCLTALQKLGRIVAVTPPPPKDPECIIENPVSLISITSQTSTITLPSGMLIDCKFALEFSRWIADVANPLATQLLGSQITKIHSGNGFTCRRRNNLPTGKLSQHAFGNAIDLLGFSMANKSTFSIKDPVLMNQSDARFFAALRKTACGYFSTVLGPGANAAHDTHLHLDLGIHGKTGNYRICE